MPSPPCCCSSGTSSLSQPISLDFEQQIRPTPSLQDLSTDNCWPITAQLINQQQQFLPKRPTTTTTHRHHPPPHHSPLSNRNSRHLSRRHHQLPLPPSSRSSHRYSYYLDLDNQPQQRRPAEHSIVDLDALIGGSDLDCSNERMMTFSSSDENLTTSESELGRVGRRRRFGKQPVLSPIHHPDTSSVSLEDLQKMLATGRRVDLDVYRRSNNVGQNEWRQQQQQWDDVMIQRRKSRFMAESEEDNDWHGNWQKMGSAAAHYAVTGGNAIYAIPTKQKQLEQGAKTHLTTMPMQNQRNSNSRKMAASNDNNNECAPRTPQRIPPTLQMVEEISPVLPRPDPDEDMDVPPLPRPLKISREWRPLQTSTLTNFQAVISMPKTGNPAVRHNKNGRDTAAGNNNNIAGSIGGVGTNNICFPDHHHRHHQCLPLDQPPRSLFDPFFPKATPNAPASARPEQFNLPAALARSFGIRGILFINVAIAGSFLLVHIRNAALFLLDHPPAVCFVKVEIRRSPSNRKRTKYDHRFRCKQTMEVRDSSWPEFLEQFEFKVSQVHLKYGDKLGLAVYIAEKPNSPAELLGRMSFSLRKLFHVAKHRQLAAMMTDGNAAGIASAARRNAAVDCPAAMVKILEGGYFLLPDRKGQQTHLSQDNISYRKYYDEIGTTSAGGGGCGGGCSSLSSASISSFGSPFKMMSEPEWPQQQQQHISSMPPALMATRPTAVPFLGVNLASQKESGGGGQQLVPKNSRQLNSSSQSSSSQSGIDCKRRPIPLTPQSQQPQLQPTTIIPSVTTDTTTSDFTSSIGLMSANSTGLALADYSACAETSIVCGEYKDGDECITAAFPMAEHKLQPPAFELATKPAAAGGHPTGRAMSQPPEINAEPKQHATAQQSYSSTTQPDYQHGQPPPLQVQACSASTSASSLTSEEQAAAVRRVASFTCSPTANAAHYKKRNSVAVPLTDKLPRKNMLGTFGKTLLKLKNKLDFSSLSASILCPTKEECRLWQESFKALLNHKYGFFLFREFLQSERSEENLEFWEECEQLKRLKDPKKIQQKAQHIFDTYVRECTPKEVNLDSETRMKTKAALDGILVKADVFELAQNKIEQLMANDSYPRFLKSDPYLEVLNEREAAEHVRPVMNGLVRVASAKWAGAHERSPSPCHSPFPSSRWGRRNTCSPASPATLQIPSSIKE